MLGNVSAWEARTAGSTSVMGVFYFLSKEKENIQHKLQLLVCTPVYEQWSITGPRWPGGYISSLSSIPNVKR